LDAAGALRSDTASASRLTLSFRDSDRGNPRHFDFESFLKN
jgi:hypothetical protein